MYYFMFSSRGYADSGIFNIILIGAVPIFGLTLFWLVRFIHDKELYALGLLGGLYILVIAAYIIGYK
jgi:hypothetical protein